ncbi:MAG: hypothetical protein ACQESF_05710 [Nanobdellota archaeon]
MYNFIRDVSKPNKYKKSRKGKLFTLGVVCGAAALGLSTFSYFSDYPEKNPQPKLEKKVDIPQQNNFRIRQKIVDKEYSSDSVYGLYGEKSMHLDPYSENSIKTALGSVDYSSISGLDNFLKGATRDRLSDILSSEWVIKKYPEMFTKLSKFDNLLENSKDYAILVQEVGPYLLDKEKIPASRKGATGYGQLMSLAKTENKLKVNKAVDESYHPIKGISAAVDHYDRYSLESVLPKLTTELSLDLAVYNYGYGNVMDGLARLVEKKGGDSSELFRYSSDKSMIVGLKNSETVDNFEINYNEFKEVIPKETENYIEKINALVVFRENIMQGKFSNISISKQPLFSKIFQEKELGDNNTLYNVWLTEAKDKGIGWKDYLSLANMHTMDGTYLRPESKVFVPTQPVPGDYF